MIEELYKIIGDRMKKMPQNSYVASLATQGSDRIIQKIGEEATEVVIAAKNKDRKQIIYEVADLWFHSLILLASFKISPRDIYMELRKRNRSSKG
jgi:phosphoribosyl-ATP pyrophosphohydrolase